MHYFMIETIIIKNNLTTEKRLLIAATLPTAICEQLQLLPTFFDVTPNYHQEMLPMFANIIKYIGGTNVLLKKHMLSELFHKTSENSHEQLL